jgi:hypothetical protein
MWQLCILLQTTCIYWQCTYLDFSLLKAPREYVLHGPLLAMYWLWLCPHSRERALEATVVRRRLFIVLMTAAHISPNAFSLRVFLTNIRWTSHYNTRQWYAFILYITFIRTVHSHPHIIHHIHMYIHIFVSSALHGRLATLSSLCPIQESLLYGRSFSSQGGLRQRF